MDAESVATTEKIEKKVTLPYLTYTFGIGLASIALIIYWGFTEFSFFISITLGGLIQGISRTIKRMWSNNLNPDLQDLNHSKNSVALSSSSFKVFGSLYAVMVVVSALWYSVGMFFNWIIG
jgi:hypothetical protein